MKRYFSPNQKKVIFFDINGTLIDKQQSWDRSFIATLDEFTGRWSYETGEWDAAAVLGVYKRELSKRVKSNNLEAPALEEKQIASLRHALKPYPFSVNDDSLKAWITKVKTNRADHAVLYPDVFKVLSALSKKYTLAAISNESKGNVVSRFKIAGLDQLIPAGHIFTSQKKKWKKPDPAIFHYAYKQMGMEPSQTVMVGNSWRNDIYGASRAGMDAVWITSSSRKLSPPEIMGRNKVIIIRRFKELLSLF